MEYRMLELIVPPGTAGEARQVVQEKGGAIGIWSDKLEDGCAILRVLVSMDRTEVLSDTLTERFSGQEGFRIILYSVEATVPQPELNEEEQPTTEEPSGYKGRISREELYADISSGSELDWIYVGMVALSALVAGMGLIYDDVAVIIGAMVIAPLLAPNVSLALSVTLGDPDLGWQAAKTNLAGLLISLATAFLMGFLLNVSLESEQILTRTTVNLGNVTIALAAGSAGVLAFTRGVPAAIVGVMVAVALLPPWVNVGLMIGGGHWDYVVGSLFLTITNLICVNLAAIVTFLVQGVRPRTWWETQKAKKAARLALAIWIVLLVILVSIIWFMNLSPEAG